MLRADVSSYNHAQIWSVYASKMRIVLLVYINVYRQCRSLLHNIDMFVSLPVLCNLSVAFNTPPQDTARGPIEKTREVVVWCLGVHGENLIIST